MLVLSRRFGEKVWVYTSDGVMVIKVCSTHGENGVKLGFDAPREIVIKREEIADKDG